jgi:hypothetical protein
LGGLQTYGATSVGARLKQRTKLISGICVYTGHILKAFPHGTWDNALGGFPYTYGTLRMGHKSSRWKLCLHLAYWTVYPLRFEHGQSSLHGRGTTCQMETFNTVTEDTGRGTGKGFRETPIRRHLEVMASGSKANSTNYNDNNVESNIFQTPQLSDHGQKLGKLTCQELEVAHGHYTSGMRFQRRSCSRAGRV